MKLRPEKQRRYLSLQSRKPTYPEYLTGWPPFITHVITMTVFHQRITYDVLRLPSTIPVKKPLHYKTCCSHYGMQTYAFQPWSIELLYSKVRQNFSEVYLRENFRQLLRGYSSNDLCPDERSSSEKQTPHPVVHIKSGRTKRSPSELNYHDLKEDKNMLFSPQMEKKNKTVWRAPVLFVSLKLVSFTAARCL